MGCSIKRLLGFSALTLVFALTAPARGESSLQSQKFPLRVHYEAGQEAFAAR